MPQRTISQFSAKEINEVDDYKRFRNTRAYLRQKSGPIERAKCTKDQIWEMARATGYNSFNKFIQHRHEWHAMRTAIPKKYIKAIDADEEVLDFTVELDREEYRRVLQVPLTARTATIRLMAACYASKEFPPGTSEDRAVEILQEYAREEDRQCCINWPQVKTIYVYPSGKTSTTYYEPRIKTTADAVIPTTNGQTIGQTRCV